MKEIRILILRFERDFKFTCLESPLIWFGCLIEYANSCSDWCWLGTPAAPGLAQNLADMKIHQCVTTFWDMNETSNHCTVWSEVEF